MSAAKSRPILAPLDEHQLQNQGLASGDSAEGTRKIHRRRMNRSSDSDNEHIPLDIPHSAPNSQTAFATIPTYLISEPTLWHMGFTRARASQLWARWNNWPKDGIPREIDNVSEGEVISFLDFMTIAIGSSQDTTSSRDQDWIACMTAWGIEPELQQAIVDPVFNSIRHSESCAFWIKDTIHMRYAALKQVEKTSRQRNAFLAQGKTAAWIENHLRIETQSETARAYAARNAPGHTVLYKGIDEGRIANFVQNWDPEYLFKMRSSAPSDFSPTRPLHYFSTQRWVAQYYASWVGRRGTSEVLLTVKPIIVQFSIPNSAIESLPEDERIKLYFPDELWRRMVWSGRRGRRLPRDLSHFHDCTVMIGTISKGPNHDYVRMDSWEEVSERNVLKFGPPGNMKPAIQYAFSDNKGEYLLSQNMAYFSKEDFSSRQYRTWRRVNSHVADE